MYPGAVIVNPDWVRSSDEDPTAPLVLLGFSCHVMTVAQAEQAVNAPMQQKVRSALVRRRLVVDLFIFGLAGFFAI